MNKKNIIVYSSSHNNYDMLKGEVLGIDFEGFEFINVDDGSTEEERVKGRQICKEAGVLYLQNKSRGVQMATQTLIEYINENRPQCKYIICFQHDVIPISENFFTQISELVEKGSLDSFGGIGFNVIDRGKYCPGAYDRFKAGEKPMGMIGLAHLGIAESSKRWISPKHTPYAVNNPELWNKPFCIEFPAWMVIGINVKLWNKVIDPTGDYQFHIWYPDVAMQFNVKNIPIVTLPHLYCLNQQEVKTKYGIHDNSAWGARNGHEYHFGEYSNFKFFKERWGWEFDNAKKTFPVERYEGTLLAEYYRHDLSTGPLKKFTV